MFRKYTIAAAALAAMTLPALAATPHLPAPHWASIESASAS